MKAQAEIIAEELHSLLIVEGMLALTRFLEEERIALCGPAYGRGNGVIRQAGTSLGLVIYYCPTNEDHFIPCVVLLVRRI